MSRLRNEFFNAGYELGINNFRVNRKNCVLSLGRRHSSEPRNPNTQTREKVCV